MADAVAIEPVSASQFPANREKNREWVHEFWPAASNFCGGIMAEKSMDLNAEIPAESNREFKASIREFFFREQGIVSADFATDQHNLFSRRIERTRWRTWTRQSEEFWRAQGALPASLLKFPLSARYSSHKSDDFPFSRTGLIVPRPREGRRRREVADIARRAC